MSSYLRGGGTAPSTIEGDRYTNPRPSSTYMASVITANQYVYAKSGISSVMYYDGNGRTIENKKSWSIEIKPKYPSRNSGELVGLTTGKKKTINSLEYLEVKYTSEFKYRSGAPSGAGALGLAGLALNWKDQKNEKIDWVKSMEVQVIDAPISPTPDTNDPDHSKLQPTVDSIDYTKYLPLILIFAVAYKVLRNSR